MTTAIATITNSYSQFPFTYSVDNVQTAIKSEVIPKKKCYFESSEFYQIRGGFIAEVIQNPAVKALETGIMEQIVDDLTLVTLASFGKDVSQKDLYASEKVIKKNAIFVDWLTVVREDSKIVAYAASSYLDVKKAILYFNATIVDEKYQLKGGLGSINHMYIIAKILESRGDLESNSLSLLTRTRNKNVARLMDSVLKNMKISGQDDLGLDDKEFFNSVAKSIDGIFDCATGITRNIYPAGLPFGSEKADNINEIFCKLGECDAYLISGKINYDKISKFIKREIKSVKDEIIPTILTNEMIAA